MSHKTIYPVIPAGGNNKFIHKRWVKHDFKNYISRVLVWYSGILRLEPYIVRV